jgi:hypothetical protein
MSTGATIPAGGSSLSYDTASGTYHYAWSHSADVRFK